MKIFFRTHINRPMAQVKAGFTRDLFLKLAPPWAPFKLERFDGCKQGDEVHIEMELMGLKQKWISLMTEEEETQDHWFFVDEGKLLPWPLSQWRHRHRVDKIGESACEITDDIEFTVSPKILEPMVWPVLWASFAIRPKIYQKYFEV